MKNIVILLRPQQWLKNGFIFIPLFFDHKLTDWYCLCSAILAFSRIALLQVLYIV